MSKLVIATLTTGALLTFGALRLTDLWGWRAQTINAAEARAANLASILSEYIRESFAAGDASLRQLALHSRRVGGPAAPDSEWMPSLTSARASLAGVGSITVTDATGLIRHSTQKMIVGESRRDEYAFKRLSTQTGDDLVASTPYLSLREPRQFLIPIARRLTSEAGVFEGIIVAAFIPAAPRGVFRTVDVGQAGAVWVFHPDGVVLFREPSTTDQLGDTAAANPIFAEARRGGVAGRVRAPLRAGGPVLLSAYHGSSTPPLSCFRGYSAFDEMGCTLSIMATPVSASSVEQAMVELKQRLGARANDTPAVRDHHSHGESYHAPSPPDVVCLPRTTDEVAEILRISARFQLPVVPFGAGTSLEGHVNAIRGGITIDLREMNKVVRVSAEDLDATVEAGVTRLQLNKALNNTGLTFPIDPGADATIGGMAATRASGTTAVRYGTMRENVLGLTVVLADGTVIRTGTRARKSSAGYDLTRLFVGSEGTLGVITEVTLRLHPLPEAVSAAVCAFDSIQGAVETVIATIQLGVPVARMELLDEAQLDAVNRYSKTSYPVAPTLFFEFHSDSARHVADQAEAVQALAAERGGRGFQWATRLEDRERLWQARHDAFYAALALRPGALAWTTDVCVPISRLAECVVDTKKDNIGAPFPICLVSHAGDGNFHLIYVLDPGSDAELDEARRLNERMVLRALAMGGTCSGEHGVGIGKMKYLEAEHGAALDVMRTIKRALDPDNRMNPGKMLTV